MLNEALVAKLIAQGVDREWIADMVHRHGPDILALIEKALLLGLNAEVTREALTLAGRIGFEIVVRVLDVKMSKRKYNPLLVTASEDDVDYNDAILEVLKAHRV